MGWTSTYRDGRSVREVIESSIPIRTNDGSPPRFRLLGYAFKKLHAFHVVEDIANPLCRVIFITKVHLYDRGREICWKALSDCMGVYAPPLPKKLLVLIEGSTSPSEAAAEYRANSAAYHAQSSRIIPGFRMNYSGHFGNAGEASGEFNYVERNIWEGPAGGRFRIRRESAVLNLMNQANQSVCYLGA